MVEDIERGRRLKEERERLGLSQIALAAKCSASKGSQILYEKGKPPTADYLSALARAGGDIGYVLTGEHLHFATSTKLPEMVRLPRYDVQASAGPGTTVATEVITDVIAFDRGFLRDLGATPDRCSIIWARGDSMVPTIPDGSILVVDHSQTELTHGCIYVFDLAGDLLVKRLRRRVDGSIDLVSDNVTIYPVETVSPRDLDQLRVIGRVVYFCRVP